MLLAALYRRDDTRRPTPPTHPASFPSHLSSPHLTSHLSPLLSIPGPPELLTKLLGASHSLTRLRYLTHAPARTRTGMGLSQSQKDLVGGSVGGMAQVLVGQVSAAGRRCGAYRGREDEAEGMTGGSGGGKAWAPWAGDGGDVAEDATRRGGGEGEGGCTRARCTCPSPPSRPLAPVRRPLRRCAVPVPGAVQCSARAARLRLLSGPPPALSSAPTSDLQPPASAENHSADRSRSTSSRYGCRRRLRRTRLRSTARPRS